MAVAQNAALRRRCSFARSRLYIGSAVSPSLCPVVAWIPSRTEIVLRKANLQTAIRIPALLSSHSARENSATKSASRAQVLQHTLHAGDQAL
jgi:hypothetical protein